MHRIVLWQGDDGGVEQVSVACATSAWEPTCEMTRPVGPFDDWTEAVTEMLAIMHTTPAGMTAHQLELFDWMIP